MSITFEVIDTSCQDVDKSFFPPGVKLVTFSTTRIATLVGYNEYIPSSPPKKYLKLTWSGTSEQSAVTAATGEQISDAKFVYSGAGQIDAHGHQIANYTKDYYSACPDDFTPVIGTTPNFGLHILKGYCWPTDPASCASCSFPAALKGNEAQNSIFDIPNGFLAVGTGFDVLTPTTLTNIGGQTVSVGLNDGGPGGTTNVPKITINGFLAPWISVTVANNYQAVLSDEFTDAMALANAFVVNSNGNTAQSLPRTTGFVSRFTSVGFQLAFSNLLAGNDYIASVDLWDLPSNTHTTRSYGFRATSTTHVINDTVPTPAAQHSITVQHPTVAFLPA